MTLRYTHIYRFFLNVQTKYEYDAGIHLNENRLVPVKPGMIHPGTTPHTETRERCEITTCIFIAYMYIWKGLESTEYLLPWSGTQNKRTHEHERESTIPYRSSWRWPCATLTFTAEWTKLWLKQQRFRCWRSKIRRRVKRVSRRKDTVCYEGPGWLGLKLWGTSDALGGLVEQQKDVPPRLPETGSLPPTAAPPPPPPRAGEEDAAAGRPANAAFSPFCLLQLAQRESQRFASSSAEHSSRRAFFTASGLTTEGKILARERFRSPESSGESGRILPLRSLSAGLPLTSTVDWHRCKETLPK